MHAYVINLRRRPDRRDRFLRWNSGKGLTFEFVDAVDGRELVAADLIERGLLTAGPHRFRNGSLGNILSQRAIWESVVRENGNIVVFEDDAFIHRETVSILRRYMQLLDDDVDILYLGFNRDAPLTIRFAPSAWSTVLFFQMQKSFDEFASAYDDSGEGLETRTYDTKLIWGTLGYVVSPRGAATLLERCFPLSSDSTINMYGQKRSVRAQSLDGLINVLLQRGQARARCFFPPLVVGPNDHVDSDILTEPARGLVSR